VQLSKELEDLVDRLLEEDVVNEMSNELLHLRSFLLLDCGSFRRVALLREESDKVSGKITMREGAREGRTW